MKAWNKRPRDEANLFNPAFCGLLLHSAIRGYTEINSNGMPFPLIFLVPPLVLHRSTRMKLPTRLSSGKALASWTVNNPDCRLGFDARMQSLVPIAREAMLFGLRHKIVALHGNSYFVVVDRAIKKSIASDFETEEAKEIMKSAHFVGRWLAHSGSTHNSYAVLGVRP